MDFAKIRNIDALADAMASGELPVDPAECFRETLSGLSGAEEVADEEIRDDYAERLAQKISRYLSLASIRDMDMDVFYNDAVKAMRPVRLTVEKEGEKSVWVSASLDIGALVEKSCSGFTGPEKDALRSHLLRTAASKNGNATEYEITEGVNRGTRAVCERVRETGKPAFRESVRKVFAAAALATYLFMMPNAAFGQSAQPAQNQSVQSESDQSKRKILNTFGIMKIAKYAEQQKKLSPDIQDEYIESESVSEKLEKLKDRPLSEKLNAVNDMWNKIPYMSDKKNYGTEDYWASPAEVQAKNAADCEDYAIGKYFSLRKAGVPASDMRILVGYTSNNEVHAVLAVWGKDSKGNDRCFILDNMHQKIQTEQSMVGKFLPRISLNENQVWSHATIKEYAETAAKIFPAAHGKKNIKNVAAKKAPPRESPQMADNSVLSSYQAMRM